MNNLKRKIWYSNDHEEFNKFWSNQFVILFIGNSQCKAGAIELCVIWSHRRFDQICSAKWEKFVDFWFLFTLLCALPMRQWRICCGVNSNVYETIQKCISVSFHSFFFKFMIKVVRAHGNYRTNTLIERKQKQKQISR